MFYRTIFVYLVGFLLVKLVEMDPVEITFKVHVKQNKGQTCDHSDDKMQQNIYTVLEGEEFAIVTKYKQTINHFICHDYTDENIGFNYKNTPMKNKTTFMVEKRMGTLWNCTTLTHRDNPLIKPVVHYKGANYTAAYCFMKIHVRQKVLPQTILVNNMIVPAVRENQVEKDVDFTAEYQYADEDFVNVACFNSLKETSLTMEYEMAGTKSDDSTMKDIFSSKMIGFVAKLHSGHNKSYMICTNTETADYTKVMIRFVMRTKFNIISIAINGMILRPILKVTENHHYAPECMFLINQPITVTCEVVQTNVKLIMLDDFDKSVSQEKELIRNKKIEMKFYLKPGDNSSLPCLADYDTGAQAESVYMQFTTANFPIDRYPSLHMKLPSNGAVMELYSYRDYKLTVIIYEFKHDETLNLICGPLILPKVPGPVLYLQLDTEICRSDYRNVSKVFHLMRKHAYPPVVCHLKEEHGPDLPSNTIDSVCKEIRVIFRERAETSTSTSSTTTTTTTTTANATAEPRQEMSSSAAKPAYNTPSETPQQAGSDDEPHPLNNGLLPVIAGIAACIIVICVSIAIVIIFRFRKRNHSQGGPQNRNYENLAEPSEASIPAYPPQWENNYAEPVDRRTDDTTYSVPCPPGDLYATPTPKNLRNKKQKPLDPTYAVLAVQKGRGKKNVFKESEDPNYSEVYANSQEQSYAKVLPKSLRNQVEQDNPYSYVTNEPPYVNTDDPEPMYCEPGKAQGAEYANLNNSHYANSNAQEYVEPTYCEPQKRMK